MKSETITLIVGLSSSISMLVSLVVLGCQKLVGHFYKKFVVEGKLKWFLKNLETDEKTVIKKFFDENKSVVFLSIIDGVAHNLSEKKILGLVGSYVGKEKFTFPYAIQPLALIFLRKNPKYLK